VSNYTQSTNFATKDALSPGDPLKIVRGTEINTEFANIAVAVATKLDTTALASPGPIGATTPSTINATTGTFSGNVQMASANGGQLAGLRNKIINGDMRIAQRGTSTAAAGSNTFIVDRFRTGGNVSSAVFTTSQSTDAPNLQFQYSARLTVTTADTAVGATDSILFNQPIEGYNARDLIGQTFTLSFWVRSAKTGIHCVGFSNNGGDRSYVVEYTISTVNTWEYKTVTVSGGLITAGTWDWTNGQGVAVRWALLAGSNSQTTAGAWQVGKFTATSNQVNVLDTIGNIFAITGVQLEVGPVATPFEQRPIGMELALCQRYFERVFMYPTVSTNPTGQLFEATTTSVAYGRVPLQAQKRAIPTVTVSGTAPTMQQGTGVTAAIGAITGLDVYGGIQVAASTTFTTAGINHFVGVVNSTALDFSAEL